MQRSGRHGEVDIQIKVDLQSGEYFKRLLSCTVHKDKFGRFIGVAKGTEQKSWGPTSHHGVVIPLSRFFLVVL